jgi:hypothetical protein
MTFVRHSRSMLIVAVTLAVLGLALPALSQQRKKIVIEEAEQVEGTVQKPQVTYIVTRQDVEDEEQLKLNKSFIPKIVESVDKEPF